MNGILIILFFFEGLAFILFFFGTIGLVLGSLNKKSHILLQPFCVIALYGLLFNRAVYRILTPFAFSFVPLVLMIYLQQQGKPLC